MPDDATPEPDDSPVTGWRFAIADREHVVLLAEVSARHAIELRRRAGWSEQRLFASIESGTLGLEGLAAFVVLAQLVAGGDPDWEQIVDSIHADMDVEFERLRAEPETDDPGEA